MKSLLTLLLAILFPALPLAAETVKSMPAPTGYVDDYAGVLSPDGKQQVDWICHQVHQKTNAQIFVVTIHSLEGETIATFANDLFHQWKIGEKKTDRGVLLLLTIGDHKWRIEVGYGLEGILPDAETGRIGRDMVPSLKAANYDQAALTGVQAISAAIARDAGVTLDPLPGPVAAPIAAPLPAHDDSSSGILTVFIVAAVILFVGIFLLIRRRSYARPYNSAAPYLEPEPVIYPVAPVIFSSPDPVGSSSSASDWSSSSSVSTDTGSSFSSDTFSGGDGGDSGGGGADGGW